MKAKLIGRKAAEIQESDVSREEVKEDCNESADERNDETKAKKNPFGKVVSKGLFKPRLMVAKLNMFKIKKSNKNADTEEKVSGVTSFDIKKKID